MNSCAAQILSDLNMKIRAMVLALFQSDVLIKQADAISQQLGATRANVCA